MKQPLPIRLEHAYVSQTRLLILFVVVNITLNLKTKFGRNRVRICC